MEENIKIDKVKYNALVVVTPADYERLQPSHARIVEGLPADKIYFVGSSGVRTLLEKEFPGNERVGFIDENEIIAFDRVYDVISDIMKERLEGKPLPRGYVGWYYQQFLKMEYCRICEDEYYMTWDGDTVPCGTFSMFSDQTGQPYFDLKEEYHAEYFATLGRVFPGMGKLIRQSFISEHMLFKKSIMEEMLRDIGGNDSLPGTSWWEKVLRTIPADRIEKSAFSEFETYGTYTALKHGRDYRLREWHSFRLGAQFFDQNTICDRDYKWLARDFQAISFEKNQTVREDHRNLFDNPNYQSKLTARQMLEIAQEEFQEGYKEIWEDRADKTSFFQNIY